MKFSKLFYKGTPSFIISVYLVVLFCIYPLFMKEGYVGIDTAKYTFFLYSSLIAIVLLLFFGLKELFKSIKAKKFSFYQTSLLFFGLISIISYVISEYKNMALYGANGWYMGLATVIIIIALSYLISALWKVDLYVFNGIIITFSIVMIITLLDRFSIYLIPLEIRNPSFLSTIGNINWLAGYISVFLPLVIGLFVVNESDNIKIEITKEIITVILFMASFAQGSDSIILCYYALFFGMLILVCIECMSYKRFLTVALLFCLSAQIMRLLRIIFVSNYNYDTNGICATLTGSSITIIIGIIVAALYLCTNEKAAKYLLLVMTFAGVAALIYVIYNFNDSFGSGRGRIIRLAFEAFRQMSFKEKIFGIGPDCFSSFVYDSPDISRELLSVWPNDVLTNAHCEIVTMLINEGIIGLALYALVFIVFIKENLTRKSNVYSLCITLSVISYLVHNLASFMQLVNFPFIMILMGMAGALNMGETLKLTENSSKII